jgi:hypothetical protein
MYFLCSINIVNKLQLKICLPFLYLNKKSKIKKCKVKQIELRSANYNFLKSIYGEQLMDQTRHTPAWRSTSVERWTTKPR